MLTVNNRIRMSVVSRLLEDLTFCMPDLFEEVTIQARIRLRISMRGEQNQYLNGHVYSCISLRGRT